MAREIKTLPPLAHEYMQWLLQDPDDRDPATQGEWCEAAGVPENTPARWKRALAWDDAWEAAQLGITTSEGAKAGVLEALRIAAMAGDVPAGAAYLKQVAAMSEPDDADVRGMTDLELADALELAAADVRARAS